MTLENCEVGMKVRRTGKDYLGIKKGEVYTIKSKYETDKGIGIELKESNCEFWFDKNGFEPVETKVFKIGDKVKMKDSLEECAGGCLDAVKGLIGEVIGFRHKGIAVSFPGFRNDYFHALPKELVKVEEEQRLEVGDYVIVTREMSSSIRVYEEGEIGKIIETDSNHFGFEIDFGDVKIITLDDVNFEKIRLKDFEKGQKVKIKDSLDNCKWGGLFRVKGEIGEINEKGCFGYSLNVNFPSHSSFDVKPVELKIVEPKDTDELVEGDKFKATIGGEYIVIAGENNYENKMIYFCKSIDGNEIVALHEKFIGEVLSYD